MELGYWKIQALAQPIRILIHYLDLKHTDTTYDAFDKWFSIKDKLGFHFPNLPYIIDGETKITESSAIPLYIAQKAGNKEILGKEGIDQVTHLTIVGVINDIRDALIRLVKSENPTADLAEVKDKTIYYKLQHLEKFIGEKHHLLGYFTYADILLNYIYFHLKRVFEKLGQESLAAKFPLLEKYHQNYLNDPKIKNILETDETNKLPLMPPIMDKIKLDVN